MSNTNTDRRGPFFTDIVTGEPFLVIANAILSCEMVGCRGNRLVYKWTIRLPDESVHSATDLESPGLRPTDAENDQEAFATLLCFLSACGEGYRYQFSGPQGRESDNADLFPLPVAKWASENVDELDMLRMELEECEECYLTIDGE